MTAKLPRGLVDGVVTDGFFPGVQVGEHPVRRRRTGLQEFGLEYASDPVLTKHLAYFLARSWQNAQSDDKLHGLVADRVREIDEVGIVCPSTVLFNGGVFKADPLRG